jgi:hypothetical protein
VLIAKGHAHGSVVELGCALQRGGGEGDISQFVNESILQLCDLDRPLASDQIETVFYDIFLGLFLRYPGLGPVHDDCVAMHWCDHGPGKDLGVVPAADEDGWWCASIHLHAHLLRGEVHAGRQFLQIGFLAFDHSIYACQFE